MVPFRFVMPVTTARGNVAGGAGVGLGDAVGEGTVVGVAVADEALGPGLPQATSSIATDTTATARNVAGVFTAVS
jgi:hypothetical protein